MNAAPLVLDIARAKSFALAAPAVGAYGAARSLKLDKGLYWAMADNVVGLRYTQGGSFRVDASGNKSEVPIQPLLPLQLLLRGPASVAARNAACVVWFVPLLAFDVTTGKLVHVGCDE